MHKGIAALLAFCASLAAAPWTEIASAQSYPTKPIKLIVPFPAGGSADQIARVVARKMTDGLTQQVIIENRGGAGGKIGVEALARSPNDGYTIGMGTSSTLAMAPGLFATLPYDPVKSFAPISLLTLSPSLVTVNASVPAKSLKELVELAKARPGQLNFGSQGYGSIHQFNAERLMRLTGIKIVHVPYQGGAPELIGLLGDQVQISFTMLASLQVQNFHAGKLRALAVLGPTRLRELPSVPTNAEAGFPGLESTTWFGLFAPAGTPAQIVGRLNQEVQKALAAKDVRDAILSLDVEPAGNSSEAFAAYVKDEVASWTRIIKESGFKPQ
ncbi:MAG: tripartite tricarboxylate transporter substrate binding protein [Burkholderiales bacterium]|nr:tripartite tricarboxylate transporter substrate binding protein [Burkholderiales bacterium]